MLAEELLRRGHPLVEIDACERGADKVRHCLLVSDALAAGGPQAPSDNGAGGQALELEKTSVDVRGWLEGTLDTPLPADGGEGPWAHRGSHGGLEDDRGETWVGAQKVLGAIIAEERVAEEGEGAVVEEAVALRGLVYEGAGQGLHGELGVQAETGMERGELGRGQRVAGWRDEDHGLSRVFGGWRGHGGVWSG